MIPANEHEVLDSAFTVYENRIRAKESLHSVADKKTRGRVDKDRFLPYFKFISVDIHGSPKQSDAVSRSIKRQREMCLQRQCADFLSLSLYAPRYSVALFW